MEYIYQKSLYQFLKKEEINKIFINKDKENIEIEIDDDILNFFLQNFKKNYKILKNKIFEYRDQEEKKKFEEFDKKLKEKNLKISKDKLENLLKEKYRVIREKVAPFITSDNLNFLISNGCSMYTGSKGINDTAKNDLLNIIERYKSKKGLQYLLKTIDFTNLSPEKVLDKLYQIDNFHTNILSKKVVSEKIKSLIKEYKEIFLKNYVLEINYKNPYLHEELLLKLVSIKKQNHINIFTLNYDILIEVSAEKLGIPINNGFQGFQIRKFNPANFNYKNYLYNVLFDDGYDSYFSIIPSLKKCIEEVEKIKSGVSENFFLEMGEGFGAEIRKEAVLLYFLYDYEKYGDYDIIPFECFYETLIGWINFLETQPDLNKEIVTEYDIDK